MHYLLMVTQTSQRIKGDTLARAPKMGARSRAPLTPVCAWTHALFYSRNFFHFFFHFFEKVLQKKKNCESQKFFRAIRLGSCEKCVVFFFLYYYFLWYVTQRKNKNHLWWGREGEINCGSITREKAREREHKLWYWMAELFFSFFFCQTSKTALNFTQFPLYFSISQKL